MSVALLQDPTRAQYQNGGPSGFHQPPFDIPSCGLPGGENPITARFQPQVQFPSVTTVGDGENVGGGER